MSDKRNELMIVEFGTKLKPLFDENQVKMVQDAAKNYLEMQSGGTGKEFWRQFLLSSHKDYANDSMAFYQCVLELQTRLFSLSDETTQLEREKLELTELELDLADLQQELEDVQQVKKDNRRIEISIRKKELDIDQKRIKLESSRISLERRFKEVQDFKELADEYRQTNKLLPFEQARYEDMSKKIGNRWVQHILYGDELSASEKALYMRDGILVPPEEAIDKFKLLGRPDLADQTQKIIDNYKNMKQNQLQYEQQKMQQLEDSKLDAAVELAINVFKDMEEVEDGTISDKMP